MVKKRKHAFFSMRGLGHHLEFYSYSRVRVQNFTDLATFSVDFAFYYMLNVRHISTSGSFDLLT